MDRRRFAAALTALGVAATALPASARDRTGNRREGEGSAFPGHGVVALNGKLGPIVATRLIIVPVVRSNQLGIDLRITVPQFNENRLGLFNPTLGRQFAGAPVVGELRQWNKTLIAAIRQREVADEVYIMNRARAWLFNADRLGRPDRTRLPALGNLPYLGRLFARRSTSRRKTQLLILVSPTIIDAAMGN